jgi:hypothetical protein
MPGPAIGGHRRSSPAEALFPLGMEFIAGFSIACPSSSAQALPLTFAAKPPSPDQIKTRTFCLL